MLAQVAPPRQRARKIPCQLVGSANEHGCARPATMEIWTVAEFDKLSSSVTVAVVVTDALVEKLMTIALPLVTVGPQSRDNASASPSVAQPQMSAHTPNGGFGASTHF